MLGALFHSVLNMSITAGIIILAVLPARFLLRRAPRIFSYLLWSAVLFRLLCPISPSSDFSLLRFLGIAPTQSGRIDYLSFYDASGKDPSVSASSASDRFPAFATASEYRPYADPIITAPTGFSDTDSAEPVLLSNADSAEKPAASAPDAVPAPTAAASEYASRGSSLHAAAVLPILWLLGMIALFTFNALRIIRLRRRLIGAFHLRGSIYLADHISMPFVMGVVFPKIYLPSSLSVEKRDYIIAHEQRHVMRGDHLIKLLAYTALCVHWFNPLVWLAFTLACKDMEMSCDEAVLRKNGSDIRADYSDLLLGLSAGASNMIGTPLAFGEISAAERIRNIMAYRRPTLRLMTAALTLCLAVSAALLFNPRLAAVKKNQLVKSAPQTRPLSELAIDRLNEDILPKGTGCNLLYEDENFIIFEPYIGLFGYDLQSHRLIFTVDFMKAFGLTGEITGEYGMHVQISADGGTIILSYIDPADPDAERDAYYIDTKTLTYRKDAPRQMSQGEAFSQADIRGFLRWDSYSYRVRYFREYQNDHQENKSFDFLYHTSTQLLSSWSLLNEYDEIPEELLRAQSLDSISYTPDNPPDLTRKPAGKFSIAYESDDFVIFYGDPGLFGYDLVKGEIVFGIAMPWVNYSAETRKDILNLDIVRACSDGTSLVCYSLVTLNDKYGWNAYDIDVPSLTYTMREFRDLPTEDLFDPDGIKGSVFCPDGNLANTVYTRKNGSKEETWHVFAEYAAQPADPI